MSLLQILIPTIEAIKSNKSFQADNKILNVIDYLIEGEIDLFKKDLEVFKLLNDLNVSEREHYITNQYGTYESLNDIECVAVIGDNTSYINVLYDYNKNTIRLSHTLINSISEEYSMSEFINLITDWLEKNKNS